MSTHTPADPRAVKAGRHPLTAAERRVRILRDNTNSRFCPPIGRASDIKTKCTTGVMGTV
jgi:hypothetical protein